jgi:hypothetical protein
MVTFKNVEWGHKFTGSIYNAINSEPFLGLGDATIDLM